jgi:hypothetical protein
MRRRSKAKAKAKFRANVFNKAKNTLDNIIVVAVCVVMTGLFLREMYRFVERTVGH